MFFNRFTSCSRCFPAPSWSWFKRCSRDKRIAKSLLEKRIFLPLSLLLTHSSVAFCAFSHKVNHHTAYTSLIQTLCIQLNVYWRFKHCAPRNQTHRRRISEKWNSSNNKKKWDSKKAEMNTMTNAGKPQYKLNEIHMNRFSFMTVLCVWFLFIRTLIDFEFQLFLIVAVSKNCKTIM